MKKPIDVKAMASCLPGKQRGFYRHVARIGQHGLTAKFGMTAGKIAGCGLTLKIGKTAGKIADCLQAMTAGKIADCGKIVKVCNKTVCL